MKPLLHAYTMPQCQSLKATLEQFKQADVDLNYHFLAPNAEPLSTP